MRHALALGFMLVSMTSSPAHAAPMPAMATVIQDLRYEPQESAIYLPFEGPRPPLVAIGTSGLNIVMDIPNTGFLYSEFFASVERSPLVHAYIAALDPESKGLHVVIEGVIPLRAEADATYRGSSLRFALAPVDPKQAATLPAARDVRQTVTAIPLDGKTPKTYTLDPHSPPLFVIPADWLKVLSQWTFPAANVSLSYGMASEQYAPQLVAGSDPGAGHAGLSWEPYSGDNLLPLRLERGASSFDDPDYAGVMHQRIETSLQLAYARRYSISGMTLGSGGGYQVSWLQTTNSATPETPTILFSGYQLMHGPVLRQTIAGSLWESPWGTVGGELALDLVPWVFATIDQGIKMPWLTSFRLEPRLLMGGEQPISLGFFYERLVGSTFNREASGVSLSLNFGRF